ncbi:MAG: CHAP domain-containing protein [Candidatus Kapabacteria bacterium]|nr:CHAP domain-containing protein [Candidatus Kapabacteria bacterium]
MKRFVIITILLLLVATVETFSASRYLISCDSELLMVSRDSLLAQVGIKEKTGRNDGRDVEAYLRSVGLAKGNPYCAAGQYWCFYSSAKDLGLPTKSIPIHKTGSTVTMLNHAIKIGQKTNSNPKVDDLMFWRRPNQWSGHVERIIEVKKAGWVDTIGFNTSSGDIGSQDDGGGVYKRKRNIHHFLGRMVVRGFIGFKAV